MNFELETQSLNFLYCLHPKPPKGPPKKKRGSRAIAPVRELALWRGGWAAALRKNNDGDDD